MLSGTDLNPALATKTYPDRAAKMGYWIHQISPLPETIPLEQHLNTIAHAALEILEAEVCGILLVRREGYLRLEASAGFSDGFANIGQEFAILSGPRTGLTGHIALTRTLYNGYGAELLNHPAVRGTPADHLPTKKCHSLLVIPLLHRDTLIGLLRVENKKKNGIVLTDSGFDADDEILGCLYADAVVSALVTNQLVTQTRLQAANIEQLVANSPTAIMALDARGHVTAVNMRAVQVLGYSAAEMMGKHVNLFLRDSSEAHLIGDLMRRSPDGRVTHETFVKTSTGRIIPIQLTAALLYDQDKNIIGSVGYFLDLRAQRERAQRIEILNRMSGALQSTDSLETLLHIALTAVTADFGLRFNRAALFLLDPERNELVGRIAIGETDLNKATVLWQKDYDTGLDSLQEYLRLLAKGELAPTSLDRLMRGQVLPLSPAEDSILQRAMREREIIYANEHDYATLPGALKQYFDPAPYFVVVPLVARDRVLGLLLADNKFNQGMLTPEDRQLLEIFSNGAAVAIYNRQLAMEKQQAQERLGAALKASSTLTSDRSPRQVLNEILEQACHAAEASWVSFVLLDDSAGMNELPFYHVNPAFKPKGHVRANGLSRRVAQENTPLMITDCATSREKLNPSMIANRVRAALCLPFQMQGQTIGVLWIHYEQPRHFTRVDIEALQQFVNHAALAYHSARRLERLEKLGEFAALLAKAMSVQELEEILRSTALELFQAQVTRLAVAEGEGEPGPEEAVPVEQLPAGEPDPHSLHLPLAIGEEYLGDLYLRGTDFPRILRYERELVKTFTEHAALAVKKLVLADRLQRASDAANKIAQVTVQEDLESTLPLLVENLHELLHCGAVTLFIYDQDSRNLNSHPILSGVHYPERTKLAHEITPESPVIRVMEQAQPYVTEDAAQDPIFGSSRFTREEKIVALMALPLRVRGINSNEHALVGVLFVNYRKPHKFSSQERQRIEFFANQAAIAIWQSRLMEQFSEMRTKAEHNTALEWMRLVSATWGHEINYAVSLSINRVRFIERELDSGNLPPIRQDLQALERILDFIRNIPIDTPVTQQDKVQPFAPNHVVKQHFCLLWQDERVASAALEWDLEPDLDARLQVVASPQWILRALDLLVMNAINAMEDAGTRSRTIKVLTRYNSPHFEILVRDSGPGLPKEIDPRKIGTAPFPKKPGHRGSGVGLMIIRSIAKLNGGELFVRDTGPQGTTLGLQLPCRRVDPVNQSG